MRLKTVRCMPKHNSSKRTRMRKCSVMGKWICCTAHQCLKTKNVYFVAKVPFAGTTKMQECVSYERMWFSKIVTNQCGTLRLICAAHKLYLSLQQCLPLCRILLGAGPAGKHECDLVDKVRNVVDHVEVDGIDCPQQVTEQVPKRIDGPASCDNDAHVVERGSKQKGCNQQQSRLLRP